MSIVDRLTINMPDDVCLKRLRRRDFTPNGGSQIFITSNETRLTNFFGAITPFVNKKANFITPITCKVDKESLINYLRIVFYEYKNELLQKYKDIDVNYWYEKYSQIIILPIADFNFQISEISKRANGNMYFQGNNGLAFGELLWKVSLAKITKLEVDKVEVSPNTFEYIFKPYVFIEDEIFAELLPIFKTINLTDEITYDFNYKNILLKGVPGTGKSYTFDNIVTNDLHLDIDSENILRINVHSASSNSDLMQGIGISSNNGQVEYKEKQGLIYNHIKEAIYKPKEPFVLILEEIQENSLNELIGDLIYLIEPSKRTNVKSIIDLNPTEFPNEIEYQTFIDRLIEFDTEKHFIKIPYLIESKTDYRKMILPNNLFVFCTSNYRDDKKVIEDNLLRRFEVIEIYPRYDVIAETEIANFLRELNIKIIQQFEETEIHSDRFVIGHANWKDVNTSEAFYKAFLKFIVEFKDVKDIEFEHDLKPILSEMNFPTIAEDSVEIKNATNYQDLINHIQNKSGYSFLT